MRRLRALTLTALVAVGAVTLSACGTTEAREKGAEADTAGQPVTVTDARGKQVRLDAPAERVVALEWAEVEMLETLGADVVGAADPKGYATWNAAEKLDDDVRNVGFRSEPSVDAIVALDPDLVVLEATGGTKLVQQLEKFVPVLVTEGSDATRNLERMREDFMMIAEAVGRTDEAEGVLADLDAEIAVTKEAIVENRNAGTEFAMADGWMQGSNVSIRMFGQGALFSDVAEAVGLVNVWQGKVDKTWGLGTVDVEGLTPLKKHEDIHFLYSASDTADVFADELAGNPIWESMPFVRHDRLHKLDKGTWTFGGPASVELFLAQLDEIFA